MLFIMSKYGVIRSANQLRGWEARKCYIDFYGSLARNWEAYI